MNKDFDNLDEDLIAYFIMGFVTSSDRTPEELERIRVGPECIDAHDIWKMAAEIAPFLSKNFIGEMIQNAINQRMTQEALQTLVNQIAELYPNLWASDIWFQAAIKQAVPFVRSGELPELELPEQ